MDDAQFRVLENIDASQFELWRGDEMVGLASYRERDGVVAVPHVETAPQHRGQGFAARLMAGLLDNLRSSQRSIKPICPYAVQYLNEHEDQQDLINR